ncbi:lysylphosphatidylglycerol synthase transmembrane domain-containing protein [Phytohabitans rumicis]|uniref:TIGR00374 family protein n=1 Tax=Phytohabitans rumicis TaxID=1076125 RepID=A0A6V8LEV9_9ACTN|nr:YbhN family protein [Phytohabitans rumicis]GFJ94814.1 hypothetical protein Prum_084560 [Phytohabitans rumicis]
MTTLAVPVRSRWWRIALVAVAGAAAVVVLRGRLPDTGAVLAAAQAADVRWAALAVLAQTLSQAMFARQQRQLLTAFGVGISPLRALAISYSRSAISMALPAGSAVSAAFAFQQFRVRGASRSTAATVAILSGVASTVGLVVLYAALPVVARPWLAIPAAALLGGAAWSAVHVARTWRPARLPRWRVLAQLANLAREARAVPARHWVATIAFAAANWLLDLACLAAVTHACGLTVGYGELATVYLAAQVARQIPLTPGGIGLIETSLLTGLVAAGAAQTGAAAAVLGYRIISFWLILPVGLTTYLGLRRQLEK